MPRRLFLSLLLVLSAGLLSSCDFVAQDLVVAEPEPEPDFVPDDDLDPISIQRRSYNASWTEGDAEYSLDVTFAIIEYPFLQNTGVCTFLGSRPGDVILYPIQLRGEVGGTMEGAPITFETFSVQPDPERDSQFRFEGIIEDSGDRLIGMAEGSHGVGDFGPTPVTFLYNGP